MQPLIDDLNTLNQIGETLNKAADVRGALDNALSRLVELIGLETGWIFLVKPEAQELWAGRGFVLAAHHNLPSSLVTDNPDAWEKGCDCQGLCLRDRLNEAYNEVRCSRLAETTGDRGGLTVHASAPLRSGRQVLGILNVAAPTWESFSPRALALLTNVGGQMGVALERARLFDLLQEKRLNEQSVLLDMSEQMLRQMDLDDITDYLVKKVRLLLHVDACALLMPGENPDYLQFRAASGWRSDPVLGRFRVPADARSGPGRVMHLQQPLLIQYAGGGIDALWQTKWLKAEKFRSGAIVPLLNDGRSLGTLVVDCREPHRFDVSEIRLLQLMANQAAMAIEKTRLHLEEIRRQRMEEELAVGRQIQLSMLPVLCPVVSGWEFCTVYEAARQVGGDFYDHFVLPGDGSRLGLVIADVSDKGVPAALFMALSRTMIRSNALRDYAPAEVLTRANQFIVEDSHSDMFVTAFYGVLETGNGRFHFANAGHNPPLWWRAAGRTFETLSAPGIVLGIFHEIALEERTINLAPGDVLLLYTDGVTEALDENQEEFGLERLQNVVAWAATQPDATTDSIAGTILAAVKRFMGSMPQPDDLTLLAVKRQE